MQSMKDDDHDEADALMREHAAWARSRLRGR
jgi:hypothetical protein